MIAVGKAIDDECTLNGTQSVKLDPLCIKVLYRRAIHRILNR